MTTAGIQFRTLPNELYAIPKAHLLFKPQGDAAFILLGDTDEITITPTVEEIERFTNEAGIKKLAITIVQQIDAVVNFTLAQLSDVNRALSLLGDSTDLLQASQVGLTKSFTSPAHDGEIFQLDAFEVENVVITDGATTTPYVLDTDFKLDSAGGFVQLLSIPAGGDGDVEITYDGIEVLSADGFKKIGIGSKSSNRGKLIIRGTNDQGPRVMVTLHDVELRPDGERNYVSDEDIDTIEIVGRVFLDETQPPEFQLGFEQDLIGA